MTELLIWVYEKKDGYEIVKAWEITEMLIAKLKEETTSINSEVLIFHIPVRESIYPERWAKMKEQYKMDEDQWSINQARIKLEDICTRTQTDCIQPHQEFRAKAQELSEMGQQLYYAQDGHWNANGNKLAAEILENHILNNYLVEMAGRVQN